ADYRRWNTAAAPNTPFTGKVDHAGRLLMITSTGASGTSRSAWIRSEMGPQRGVSYAARSPTTAATTGRRAGATASSVDTTSSPAAPIAQPARLPQRRTGLSTQG